MDELKIKQRDQKILEMREQGRPLAEIAGHFKISKPRVFQILKKMEGGEQKAVLTQPESQMSVIPSKEHGAIHQEEWRESLEMVASDLIKHLQDRLGEDYVHASVPQLATALGIVIDKYRLLSGRSTENIFKLDLKTNMTSTEMLRALNGYRENNIRQNTEGD